MGSAERIARMSVWVAIAGVALAMVGAVIDLGGRLITEGHDFRSWVKLTMYWGSWALIPALMAVTIRLFTRPRWRVLRAVAAFVLIAGCWAFLVEPRLLTVREYEVAAPAGASELRVALVADIHVGLNFRRLDALVDKLNEQPADVVVVAGDWSYEPRTDLCTQFQSLSRLNKPAIGVLGNHDLQKPGPPLASELRTCLTGLGVQLIDGTATTVKGWEFVGLSDAWGADPAKDATALFPRPVAPRVVVFHQPDTAALVPADQATLMVAGHTHGGQIFVPFLTREILSFMSDFGWTDGLYDTTAGSLVVTTGVGTVGPPARFATPPRIELITLKPPA